MRLLADTNIVLRWIETDSAEHETTVRALDKLFTQKTHVCICAQVLVEFWVVATRPRAVNGLGLTADEAAVRLREIEETFLLLPEPSDIAKRWADIVTANSVLGKQAHDARLVALMLSHGISQILTLNPQDFARYPEITPLTPAEVLSL